MITEASSCWLGGFLSSRSPTRTWFFFSFTTLLPFFPIAPIDHLEPENQDRPARGVHLQPIRSIVPPHWGGKVLAIEGDSIMTTKSTFIR